MEIDRLLSKVLSGSPPNTTKRERIITIRVPRIIPWTNTKERTLLRPVRMAFGHWVRVNIFHCEIF